MSAMTASSGTRLHVATTLRVPLKFAFRWCTDFRADDARREGEKYQRRILEKTPRRVVYEDLESDPAGWRWARHVVTLRPPDRWHSDSVGNYREATLDYRLTALGRERTRIELTWTRRSTPLAGRSASRRSIEAGTHAAWRRFAKSMESEYRKSRRK